MQWSSILSIGSATFDLARRHCMAALARLVTAKYLQLRDLTDTLRAAFADPVMERMGFPGLNAHRRLHQPACALLRGRG